MNRLALKQVALVMHRDFAALPLLSASCFQLGQDVSTQTVRSLHFDGITGMIAWNYLQTVQKTCCASCLLVSKS